VKYLTLVYLSFIISVVSAQNFKKLHKKAIVVDTHNDVMGAAIMRGLHLENDLKGKTHSDLKRFEEGGVDAQVFSIFCDATFGKDNAFKFANIEIDSLYTIARRNSDKLEIVRNADELLRVIKQDKLAAIIGVEGGHMIEDNLLYLDSFFNRGARYLTLTWNNSTSWATSSLDETKDSIKTKGLKDFGKTVVKRMNELGMMIDVSHLGEKTLTDVLNISTKPVIASHSSVYAINPHHRNLKDEQIKAIAKNGGVIHINFYSGFLDNNYAKLIKDFDAKHQVEIDSLIKLNFSSSARGTFLKEKYASELKAVIPPLSVLLDHIDHIVKLVGVDHAGLGSDFDGIPLTPIGIQDVSQYPNITKGLIERGYNKKEIRKILGGNFLRVFRSMK
jgi:membrane dipeptidase